MNVLSDKYRKILGWLIVFISSTCLCALLLFMGLFYYFTGTPDGFVKFFQTLYIVETQYADKVNKPDLLDGALEGIVAKLQDKHSMYLDGNRYAMYSDFTSASFGGIGLYIGSHGDEPIVDDVISGEPADVAGVHRGDIIVSVDDKPVKGMELPDVAAAIRGEIGTKVSITFRRDDALYTASMERGRIHVKTVVGQMVPNTDIGYIRIAIFSENTGAEFAETYQSLRDQGMKKMILDLRNNPGGLLDQALAVSTNFFPKDSTLASYVTRNGVERSFTSSGTDDVLPLVVLINENSASASEIIAGDVQDLKLGTVVGTKSYGKGTVQGIYTTGADEAVKVTVAKYKTSNGRIIDGTGIQPDVVVPLQPNDEVDRQFAKAVEILNQ